jgi:hypothetical protein
MERVSIITSDEGFSSIFIRDGENIIEAGGTNHPWLRLFWAVGRMKVLKIKQMIKTIGSYLKSIMFFIHALRKKTNDG